MVYTVQHIAGIIGATVNTVQDIVVEHLLLDSRKMYAPGSALFFALPGPRRDGHQFIPELYKRGVRSFVVSTTINEQQFPEGCFLQVPDTLAALQQLAAYHRSCFNIPVIGITGSNGKTIVKEWLYQLLHEDFTIVRSPRSYNSQTGVPLSVWQMNEKHTLAIFEAGISRPGEMEKLERIIKPTLGILTNIGEAHSEGFLSAQEKETEKRKLFRDAVLPETPVVKSIDKGPASARLNVLFGNTPAMNLEVEIPFNDDASIQNAITCLQVLHWLKLDAAVIRKRMKMLQPVNMRLELKKGINNCTIINDSYSADLSSLEIALNFLAQQSNDVKKTVILSDFLQSALPDKELYAQVLKMLQRHGVSRFIGIGERMYAALPARYPELELSCFSTREKFMEQFRSSRFKDETILIKGARVFEFEDIVQLLEQKAHQTVLEINLSALVHNLKEYQRVLQPSTKVMAMVKAFAYGSGGAEIAGVLQYNKVDYLGVAYADEGVELRKAGIRLPVMVMNPEPSAFEKIVTYNLEPELYSFDILQQFDNFLQQEGLTAYPVHIELETGMNRLGFSVSDIEKLATALLATPSFNIQTVFSHLAASEEAANDAYTQQQFALFEQAVSKLKSITGLTFLTHIANSAAAIRHPHMQLDMVRLGIGLYGVDSAASGKLNLQTVATLRSTIAQIKRLKKGESVSYNRKGVVTRDAVIATIRLGYADGYPRRLGNGAGYVIINGQAAPITGTVCMDMFMADVTDIAGVKEGDDVIVFGTSLRVEELAARAGTIPYEIMTGISQRVKRVYFEE